MDIPLIADALFKKLVHTATGLPADRVDEPTRFSFALEAGFRAGESLGQRKTPLFIFNQLYGNYRAEHLSSI